MSYLARLPTEIILLIFDPSRLIPNPDVQELPVQDYRDIPICNERYLKERTKQYQTLRLVCKSFNAVASESLFSCVIISSREFDLERLRNIAAHPLLSKLVKEYEYKFYTVDFENLPESRIAYWSFVCTPEESRPKPEPEKLNNCPPTCERRACCRGRRLARKYPRVPEDAREFLAYLEFEESNDLVNAHFQVLSALPSLRAVSITFTESLNGPFDDRNMTIDVMVLSNAPKWKDYFGYRCKSPRGRWGVPLFKTILKALDARVQNGIEPVQSLRIHGLDQECVEMILKPVESAFSRLGTFELRLRCEDVAILQWHEIVGQWMRNAQSLTALSLRPAQFDPNDYQPGDYPEETILMNFKVFFMKCSVSSEQQIIVPYVWPKLRKFNLTCCNLWRDDLLAFLEAHRSTLRTIGISFCSMLTNAEIHSEIELADLQDMENDTWPAVFHYIRNKFPDDMLASDEGLYFSNLRLDNGPSIFNQRHFHEEYIGPWVDWMAGMTVLEPRNPGTWYTAFHL